MTVAPLNLADFERLAATRVEASAWDYYRSGADDEVTLRRNRAAFEAIALHYRVLAGVAEVDRASRALDTSLALPVMIAPTAFHRLAHPDGELATARAAAAAGTIMVLSTLSNTPIEAVAAAAPGRLWFQLYVYRDRAATRRLVERVAAAGARALVVTVDTPVLGRRERDVRNGFALPPGLTIANLVADHRELPAATAESGLAAYFHQQVDPSLSWRDLDWLATTTALPILVKGVVRPDDAQRALDHGAAGVVVSNHGGRQLDGAPATIDVLGAIADRIGGRLELHLDGGVRRGTDVVKALALGARTVWLGRPILWGLAAGGEAGVRAVLELVADELGRAMTLCGCPTVASIGRDLVAPAT